MVATKQSVEIRDRIKELRRVKASELIPNPRNPRRHPDHQSKAVMGLLSEIGYSDALLAHETPEGLKLIDGHLRQKLTPDSVVPVLVLDVTEDEANKLLLTLDPLSALAGYDRENLDSLLREVSTGDVAVSEMLAGLARENQLYETERDNPLEHWRGMPEFKHEDQTAEAAFTIRVFLKDKDDLEAFGRLLDKDLTGRKFVWFGKQPQGTTFEAV